MDLNGRRLPCDLLSSFEDGTAFVGIIGETVLENQMHISIEIDGGFVDALT